MLHHDSVPVISYSPMGLASPNLPLHHHCHQSSSSMDHELPNLSHHQMASSGEPVMAVVAAVAIVRLVCWKSRQWAFVCPSQRHCTASLDRKHAKTRPCLDMDILIERRGPILQSPTTHRSALGVVFATGLTAARCL